jgi:hypothetical protein
LVSVLEKRRPEEDLGAQEFELTFGVVIHRVNLVPNIRTIPGKLFKETPESTTTMTTTTVHPCDQGADAHGCDVVSTTCRQTDGARIVACVCNPKFTRLASSNDFKACTLDEVELVPPSDGNCNDPGGQRAISGSRYQEHPCKAFGNYDASNWSDEWISASGSPNDWIGWDFASKKVLLTKYVLRASICCNGDVQRAPKTWVVEGSSTGDQWHTIDDSHTNKIEWSIGQERTFNVPEGDETFYRYLRVRGTSGGDGTYMQYSQMSFYGKFQV